MMGSFAIIDYGDSVQNHHALRGKARTMHVKIFTIDPILYSRYENTLDQKYLSLFAVIAF